MRTLSRQTPKRGDTCQRCMVIRYFVLIILSVAIFTLIVDDGMRHLASFTPMHAAMAIIAVGMIGFLVKLVIWKMSGRKTVSGDPAQSAPTEAWQDGNDHSSSH
jgi:disulfide bond formation protein DsbB